jgi:hypothetical protein
MSRADSWVPLNVGDYLADTMDLNTEQHGAYCLLLFHYWKRGPIPDDERTLASITKLTLGRWRRRVGPAVRAFFSLGEDGLLHQGRADEERARTRDISAKRAEAARQSHVDRGVGGGNVVPIPAANASANASANAAAGIPAKRLQPVARLPVQEQGPSLASSSDSEAAREGERERFAGAIADLGPAFSRGKYSNPQSAQHPDWPAGVELGTDRGSPAPVVNGMLMEPICEAIFSASGTHRGADVRPIIEWLLDGYTSVDILPAIERVAGRPGYRPPRSFGYFDGVLRERPPIELAIEAAERRIAGGD